MIPDVHLQRFLYLIKVRFRPTYFVRPGGHWSTTKKAFVILIRYSDSPEDEADVCTREKS